MIQIQHCFFSFSNTVRADGESASKAHVGIRSAQYRNASATSRSVKRIVRIAARLRKYVHTCAREITRTRLCTPPLWLTKRIQGQSTISHSMVILLAINARSSHADTQIGTATTPPAVYDLRTRSTRFTQLPRDNEERKFPSAPDTLVVPLLIVRITLWREYLSAISDNLKQTFVKLLIELRSHVRVWRKRIPIVLFKVVCYIYKNKSRWENVTCAEYEIDWSIKIQQKKNITNSHVICIFLFY